SAAAPHGAFPCQGEDRWCTIACTMDAEWQALCRVMGNPSWARDERFATLLGRKTHEDELEQRVGAWTRGWDARVLMHALQRAGGPAGVVQVNREGLEDPQLTHPGHFISMDH